MEEKNPVVWVGSITTQSKFIEKTTEAYIKAHPSSIYKPDVCTSELLYMLKMAADAENAIRPSSFKLYVGNDLPMEALVGLIAARKDIALIAPGDKSQTGRKRDYSATERMQMPIAMYHKHGPNAGVWENSNDPYGDFGLIVEQYTPGVSRKAKREIFDKVKGNLTIREKCMIPYYVPVNNGIWDALHKKMIPFARDLVFTSKIHTDLDPTATNPVIHIPEDGTDWDVDSWLASLGDPDFVMSIKEVIQAACLPLAPRDKMCWFFSKSGNNGKGTLCQLIRNILGENATVSISLKGFEERFGLAGLANAIAVITDENDVSSLHREPEALKAAITGDKISVEKKYQDAYDYTFNGLILQCVNDYPKFSDKTGSFKRRLHIIPFPNCFTGTQKRYIKSRLIYREDVLEYILKMVLIDMPYRDAFTETSATKSVLAAYDKVTNSVVAFLDEILPDAKWDLLPATDFLYEGYKAWYKRVTPSGKVIGRNEFFDSVKEYVNADPACVWEWTDSTRSQGYINCNTCEPLLTEYDLVAFQDDTLDYHSYRRMYADPKKLKSKYSGLKRRLPTVALGVITP